MDPKEYKQLLSDDFNAAAEANSTTAEVEFISYIIGLFNDCEEVLDLHECYFVMNGFNNKKILIDGYAYDESDKSFTLFFSKYDQGEEISTITMTEITQYCRGMEAFIENSLTRFIQRNSELSAPANAIADDLFRKFNNKEIYKLKFYIVTNSLLSDRAKQINYHDVGNLKTEVFVWDIERIYNADSNNREREPISICVTDYVKNGLPCVRAFGDENRKYIAYLAVIPGEMLSDVYEKYGSRLLEGNVRSFLSTTGKVNKGIRETILNAPEYFFTYNNGIATTASNIETQKTSDGLYITKIDNMQIINGGQTTASLTSAKITRDAILTDIFVPMKITILSGDNNDEMIEKISKYANSQNTVSEADFFSNKPFHIKFERLSKECLAPAVNGNQYQTMWFYERARGSYKQEQMKLTKAGRDKFALTHPRSQVVSKTDLAKYYNSINQKPDKVSKGAQKNMLEFASEIGLMPDAAVNTYFFKKCIASAILFKETEKIVSKSSWYSESTGYRANIVTYSIAKLFNLIENQYPTKTFDIDRIWRSQSLYPSLMKVLEYVTERTSKQITLSDRQVQNVTEWCKREICWENYKKVYVELPKWFADDLIDKNIAKDANAVAAREQHMTDTLQVEVQVAQFGSEYWHKLHEAAKKLIFVNAIEDADLKMAERMDSTGITPNIKVAKRLLDFEKKCQSEGIIIDKPKIK